jgi:hypothetical protein
MAKDPAQRFSSARELAHAAASLVHDRTGKMTRPWQPIPAGAVNSYPDTHGSDPQWWQHAEGPPHNKALRPRQPNGAHRGSPLPGSRPNRGVAGAAGSWRWLQPPWSWWPAPRSARSPLAAAPMSTPNVLPRRLPRLR